MNNKKTFIKVGFAQPREKFHNTEKLASKLLLLSTILALIWANSPWQSFYHELWHISISLSIGDYALSNSLAHWINDGLMFIFFLVIGLEIKRELLVGELRSIKKAALPLIAALGGMLLPGLFYYLSNWGGVVEGWGIPVATDIAFALGSLMVLKNRIPASLKVFLLALAIFDDMGAILIIALFYSTHISVKALLIALLITGLLVLLNYLGVSKTTPYILLGAILWLAFVKSGIHATIAGVILAFTIPYQPNYNLDKFREESKRLWSRLPGNADENSFMDDEQRHTVKAIKEAVENVQSPLRKLEDTLHPWASLFIIPVFALANAGVNFTSGEMGLNIMHPVTLGVILGLLLGKPLGITLFSWLAVKAGLANLPTGTDFKGILGLGCLGGIGFTMSLFIINLAFIDPLHIHQAKLGILLASALSAWLGIILLSSHYPAKR